MSESPKKQPAKLMKVVALPPPTEEEFELRINFTSHSEHVAKWMVEKLISLAVRESDIEKIEREIPDECFWFTKSLISTYLKSQYISYDRDEKPREEEKKPNFTIDGEIDDNTIMNSNKELLNFNKLSSAAINTQFIDLSTQFYNNYYHGENNWDIIEEPKSANVDRYASSMIGYQRIEEDILPKSSPAKLEEIHEEEDGYIKRNATQKSVVEEKPGEEKKNLEKKLMYYKKPNKNKESPKKKKIAEIMAEMSYHDIEGIDDSQKVKFDMEMEELRKEKEDEIKKIEEEKKLKVKEKKEAENKTKEEENKFKQYEKKKITTDVNGNIILIKALKLEQLQKEFVAIKSNTKNIREKRATIITAKPKEESDVIGNYPVNKEVAPENDLTNSPQPLRSKNTLPKIERDAKRKITKLILDPGKKKEPEPPVLSELELKIERGPIIPSGSCFDKISLEIGVNIQEDKKYKTGGKDFFQKFHKYSLETYNKQLRDTISSNLSMVNYPGFPGTSFNNTEYNYQSNLTEPNFAALSKGIGKKNMITSSNFTKTTNHLMNQSAYNPSIKLSANTQYSLRSAMDTLSLISENQEKHLKFHGTNIFKGSRNLLLSDDEIAKKTRAKRKLEEMNQFATGIMTSDNWGTGYSRTKKNNLKPRQPVKPQLKEYERELGKTTLSNSRRLPRLRGIMLRKNAPALQIE